MMYNLGIDEAMTIRVSICNGHSSILCMLCKIVPVNLYPLVKAPTYNHKLMYIVISYHINSTPL